MDINKHYITNVKLHSKQRYDYDGNPSYKTIEIVINGKKKDEPLTLNLFTEDNCNIEIEGV